MPRIDWRLLILGLLLSAIVIEAGVKWYRTRHAPEGTYIRVFGGMLVLPSGYAFDMASYTNRNGASFLRYVRPGGRVVVGAHSDLKPDFWEWVRRTRTTETEQCGAKVIRLIDRGHFATLLHNGEEYVFFAGVPEADVAFALTTLCRVGR